MPVSSAFFTSSFSVSGPFKSAPRPRAAIETFPATAAVGEIVRRALDVALADPLRTYDLARGGPTVGTRAFAERVLHGVELAAATPGHARG